MALADDFVLTVRQIRQYPQQSSVLPGDGFLLQNNGLGGPYMWATIPDALATAMVTGGWLNLAPGPAGGIAFNGAAISFQNGAFQISEDVHVPSLHSDGDIFVNGKALANQIEVTGLFDVILENSVWTFNGRKGNVLLETEDVLRAGAAPIWDAHFGGHITAPTPWDVRANDNTVATCAWVQQVICQNGVHSFMCRHGDIFLTADDVTFALTQPGVYGRANTAPLGDASSRIATTMFVDNAVADFQSWANALFETKAEALLLDFAPLNSPNFTGIPTAPTPNPGSNTGQLATTAFVQAAVTAATTGVSSFNARTGAVVLTAGDVTAVGGALLASPALTGNPTAPTAAPGDNDTSIATTAFVHAAVAAVTGVASFNTRTGAVSLTLADVTAVGGAPIASPTFTGVPAAPTATPATSTTQLATTAFVAAAIAALPAPVSSFNSRTGAVTLLGADVSAAGGALIASPTFTGAPAAPTPAPGDSSTKLATTAFVAAALAAAGGGVTSFNTRSGAVTLLTTDVTGVGGALLASPTFTGTPAAPTATAGTNSTQLATTAFVAAALAAAPGGVSSFNTRTGAITLIGADLSAAGGALLASPTFTGAPKAPTPVTTDNSTTLATTAFVAAAIAAAGGVTSFNSRAGVVTLTTADITGAGGAPIASPTFTGVPAAPTATAGTNTTQLATTAFVAAAAAGGFKRLAIVPFKASGTWTKNANLVGIQVECWGGGGCGNSVVTNAGGSAGGYARKWWAAASLPATVAVTIGAGGTSATPLNGGDTTFASTPSVVGGGGKVGGSGLSVSSGGDEMFEGSAGNTGAAGATLGPGGIAWGIGQAGLAGFAIQSAPANSGGGGASGGTAPNSLGGSGYCRVTEYYSV